MNAYHQSTPVLRSERFSIAALILCQFIVPAVSQAAGPFARSVDAPVPASVTQHETAPTCLEAGVLNVAATELLRTRVSPSRFIFEVQNEEAICVGGTVQSHVALDIVSNAPVAFDATSRIEVGRLSITAPRISILGRLTSLRGNVAIRGAEEVAIHGTIRTAGGKATTLIVNGGRLQLTGSLRADGGGAVQLRGDQIRLAGASVDASSLQGGGTITIGGKRPFDECADQSSNVLIDVGTVIRSDGGMRGDGGDVVIWSEDRTYFSGTVTSRGGEASGDGGTIEVSSRHWLAHVGHVDAGAPNGSPGTVLIDPLDLLVDAVGPDDPFVADGTMAFDEPDPFSPAVISAAAIESLGADVILQATNDVTVSSPVTFISGNNLAIEAGRDITIDAAVSGVGSLAVSADASFPGFVSDGNGTIRLMTSMETTGTIELQAGSETIVFSDELLGSGITCGSSVSFDLAGNQSLDAGAGTLTLSGSASKATAGSLTLTAGSDIHLGGDVTVSGGDLITSSDVVLQGSGSQTLSASAGTLSLGGMVTRGGAGDVSLVGGTSVQLDGDLTVGAGSLSVDGPLTISGGAVSTSGTQVYDDAVTLAGDVTLTASKVDLKSDVDAGSNSASTLTVNGDLELVGPSVKLEVEIGGTSATEYDRLIVNGALTASGTLEVKLIDSFVPQACDLFEVIAANSVSGSFDTVIAPDGFDIICAPPGDCTSFELIPLDFPTVPWYEDFDDYAPGSTLHGSSGWKGWDDDPAFDAPVTDAQANSNSQSVAVEGDANIVHQLCNNGGAGTYIFSAWQYIPSDFTSGEGGALDGSYFILLNSYDPLGADHYSVQLQFDANVGLLRAWQGDGDLTVDVPYATDRWVKIQTIIDIENDWTQIYYDDELVTEYTWTGGITGEGGGALDLAVVDLYANGSSIVYYDDLSLEYCHIEDNFELYADSSSLHDQGGWKGWDDDPAFSAPVTQDESRSGAQSADVAGATDIVHEYCTIDTGLYSVSAWQYIPSDFVSGGAGSTAGSYFVLLNTYHDGGPYHWSGQLRFDSSDGLLKASYGDGSNTIDVPYATDRWVKIQTIVDLEDDWTRIYYDDTFVAEYEWTGGVFGEGGGAHSIAAVDLYANGSSSVYYDDTRVMRCELGEDFEPYADGSQLHGRGGWRGWDDDPAFSAPVSQDQAKSGSQSVEVADSTNLVHEYCTLRNDLYVFSAWQYIPGSFVSGGGGDTAGTYFTLYNTYNHYGPYHASLRMQVDANTSLVKISSGDLLTVDVPYITDRWVRIQSVIDLENDWTRVYYDDTLVTEYQWTGGVIGDGGGALDIAAVDLYANGSSSVYYDDVRLERGCRHSENFDLYLADSQLHGQGGWKGKDNDPTASAPVTDEQSRSAPQAADISGQAELIHEICTPGDGVYSYEAWQYIPGDFVSGGAGATDGSYFYLLNTYADGLSFEPSVQLQVDSNDGMLKVFHGDGNNTIHVPYINDRWVRIQNIVDLDNDWTQVYYDDALVTEYTWTGGVLGGGAGALDIAAVDLFAKDSTSIYYDDLTLTRGCGVGRDSDADDDGSSLLEEFLEGTDSCDEDTDQDGFEDGPDNCPTESNSDQLDCDGDGFGDVCTITSGRFGDCDTNAVPDNCDVTPGPLTFGSPIATGGGTGFLGTMVAGRFNNDPHLDVALGHPSNPPGTVTVFIGLGDGSFQFAIPTDTNVYPDLRAAADFTDDGVDDLAGIDSSGSAYVLQSNGDGTLMPPVLISPPESTLVDLETGDFDRDGRPDLAMVLATGGPTGELYVLYNRGALVFEPSVPVFIDPSPQSLAVGDVHRDGYPDVVIASGGAEQRVQVVYNDGAGTLSVVTNVAVGDGVQRVALGDLNADGHLDLALSRFNPSDVAVLLHDGGDFFSAPLSYPAAPNPQDLVVRDFDRDGRLDVAVSHSQHYSILRGLGGGALSAPVNVTQAFVPFPGASVFGDFNSNGRSDWVSQDSFSITTLFNETDPPAGADCNGNNVIDSCELAGGASDCQPDGVLDSCQLAENDCNDDGVPDDCQIASNDCNGNGLLDACESGPDCDGDGVPDDCEADGNGNGVPDDCETNAPLSASPPFDVSKNRYVSLDPNNEAQVVALEILLPDGRVGWVGEPQLLDWSGIDPAPVSLVEALPVFRAWPETTIHVTGCVITPGQLYELRATSDGVSFSAPLQVQTIPTPTVGSWADLVGSFDNGTQTWSPPNGFVNFNDIDAAVKKFQTVPTAPHVSIIDLHPQWPNYFVNFADIDFVVKGFQGVLYPVPLADCETIANCPLGGESACLP